MTVLIVEDEALIRFLLVDVFTDEGFQVLEAKDGKEARARFGADVDLVLLDMRLPDADGMTLLRECKASYPDVRVAIMTGHGTPDVEARARALGADAFFHKPFLIDGLVKDARRLLRAPAPAVAAPAPPT